MTLPALTAAMPDRVAVRRALLSVFDKTGLVDLARRLHEHGVELVSTGGTARALLDASLPVTLVEEVTGHPEIMDGRVKTLHPRIHGGLLGVPDLHGDEMSTHGIAAFDLVVVNLYPFEKAAMSGDEASIIENIDVGGPAMLRAAAKNFSRIAVLSDPAPYDDFDIETTLDQRRAWAREAFARTARYDATISSWMGGTEHPSVLIGTPALTMRYGENPHQTGALFRTDDTPGPVSAERVQGRDLSYNNVADADAALACAASFEAPTIVIVKHANPCGVATAPTLVEAHALALRCDPTSAFGGIVAANRPLDEAAARAITAVFTEVVIAPDADEAARAVFAEKPNLRLLLTGTLPEGHGFDVRTVAGGFLVQSMDAPEPALRTVTARAPTETEMADLHFAWTVARHVKSNAIVLAKGGATVGIGAGQMSRVDAARIAVWKAHEASEAAGVDLLDGCVVASDAFFPFPDALELALEAGARAVIQPGGSKNDEAVIAAANAAGAAMVLTSVRHFRH